ncbi:MAG TPA: sugar ABC transporter permease [Sedimentibacter sp.]|jgi:raffinose/stachyose/melibiose transport system permease protein|nr:sugar ABC transporter permease [Sedimentibacter sp.]HHY99965.1 sugar ABC transporter permease [Tissierellia bacterium]HOV26894.1 sugar ABC transporter permease [Pseudobacteroides sp.]HRC81040.1 sugar ABC transporter permease [Sedimentibacter sp.]
MNIYRNKKVAILFMLPALVFVILFIYYPIIQNFIYSLYRWSSFSEVKVFVGFDYYKRLLSDPIFYIALKNNALYAIISIVFQVGVGMILAAVLEEKIMRRYQTFFRTVYFMPSVISITVVGLLFQLVYNPNIGLLNAFLKVVGLETLTHDWLGRSDTAMFAIIATSQWQYIGYIMLLFLVAIQKIPEELYESAMIDGANAIQKFIHVTIPQIKETILVTSIITIIGAFKVFDEVYVMTAGGPGRSTEVLASYMYRAGFRNDEMGYAATIATVIFLITFIVTLIQLKVSKEKNEA